MTGQVFVVQRPAYYDRERRGWVNKYDLGAAEKYGELVILLNPGNIYRDRLENATRRITEALKSYGPDDYILAIGDPVAIAITVMAVAMRTGGVVNLLKYDRSDSEYYPYTIDVRIPVE